MAEAKKKEKEKPARIFVKFDKKFDKEKNLINFQEKAMAEALVDAKEKGYKNISLQQETDKEWEFLYY